MAPKSQPPTLAFDGKSREADNVSSFVRGGDGFMTAWYRHAFKVLDAEIPAEEESQ
jgi:hypothetical protein